MRKQGSVDDFAKEQERLIVYESLTWIDVVRDQERFMLDSLKALNIWERLGRPPGTFIDYTGLTIAADFLGLHRLSRTYNNLALKTARELAHSLALGLAHMGLTNHNNWSGYPTKAREHGQKAARYFRKAGFLRGLGGVTFMMADRQRQAGHWWEKSLALANEIDQPYEQAMTNLEMGKRLGKPELMSRAKTILTELGARKDLNITILQSRNLSLVVQRIRKWAIKSTADDLTINNYKPLQLYPQYVVGHLRAVCATVGNCEQLSISRGTFNNYLRYRGVKIGCMQ